MKKSWIGFFFTLPTMIVILAIVVYPLVRILVFSFFRVTIFIRDPVFYGLRNYINLFGDPYFWNSVHKTLVWTVGGVSVQVLLGLGVALLVNRRFKGRNVLRAAVFFPYLVPIIMATMVWSFIFNDIYGVVNYLLLEAGIINAPITWWASPRGAMFGLIVVGVWKYSPFCVISLLAGLQTIPDELYEVAQIDGAPAFKRFLYITLPSIMPMIMIVALLRSIWVFNDFNLIHLLTRGGPLDSTRTLPLFIFQEAFQQYNLGSAAAGGTVNLAILLILLLLYLRMEKRRSP